MNKPKNMLKKDKLSIHIIYVKTNQSYFTYDSDTGNGKNQIIDPIAVIYTGGDGFILYCIYVCRRYSFR